MTDEELAAFLAWALPRRGYDARGFRHVESTLRRRLRARLRELGLPDLVAYRARLVADRAEWPIVDGMCRMSISRFHRDRAVFDVLASDILPELSRTSRPLRVWSAGCASGEEPYTIAILWDLVVPHDSAIEIVATDADEHLLERARRGCYRRSSLRELPESLATAAFRRDGDEWCVRDEHRAAITFRCEDLRDTMPAGPFDLILCRYVAFTYFDETLRRETAERLLERLGPGGMLVVGALETLPAGLAVAERSPHIYRRSPMAFG